MRKNEKGMLPIFGVGPIYVISCLIITVGGLVLDYYGFLKWGEITRAQILMFAVGIMFIIVGFTLWIKSVLLQKIGTEIEKGNLVTSGVYSIVRNPIYSAFLFIFTGFLFFACNLYLLLLPFIFWAYLTILMKFTEEKWLKEKFGDEYVVYLKKVNRVIPWFRRK